MLHAGIEALFGRNRDGHRTRNIFRLLRHHHHHQHKRNEQDEIEKFFSSKPHLDKELLHQSSFGFGAMQGWRSTMEDKHQHRLPLDQHLWKLWDLFAIFDGHHGVQTANYVAENLHVQLIEALNEIVHQKNDQSVHCSELNHEELYEAIKKTFLQLDQQMKQVVKDDSGCVCISCLIGPEEIYLINIGDSRGIIFSNDGQVLLHTEDHKPDDPAEQERIHEAGGTIGKTCAGDVLRVENQLAMTRVLGDFGINKEIVPPMADILSYSRNSTVAFIVLACDGIWDVMSNDDVAKFVTQRVEKHSLEEIASELLDECLRRESTDNMSLYIIKI